MEFIIQKASEQDIGTILQIIRQVLASMPNKEWYAADSDEITITMLTNGTAQAYLALEQETNTPAGVFITTFPGNSSENLGIDAGLSNEELMKTAHMDSVAVLPAFRGHHLQKKLMLAAEEILQHAGYRYLFCTVHPDNKYSLNAVLSQGYQIVTICEKYDGYQRAVLMKQL